MPGLPDGRVYELVTPAENHDADVYVPLAIQESLLNPGETDIHTRLPFQVSTSGDAVAYVGESTVGGTGSTGAGLGNEYLATRAPGGGWTQVNLQPLGINSLTGLNSVTGIKSARYQAFSNDLSVGILESGSTALTEPVLSVAAPSGYRLLYTHVAGEAGARPFFTTTPPNRSALEFGTPHVPELYSGVLAYAGGSADSSQLLFEANDALTPNALDGGEGENNLYDSVDRRLSLVNVLPDGAVEANATFGARALMKETGNPPDFSHVISASGSRIFWTDLTTGDLYVRENATQPQSPLGPHGECTVAVDSCTVQLDAAAPGGATSGGGRFWTASSEGEKVFFTDERKLTSGSRAEAGAPDLYEYDFDKPMDERLTDLTAGAGVPAGVQSVLGASEDGSYVYFVAKEVLATNKNSEENNAEPGGENLYGLRQGEQPRFIATLSSSGGGSLADGSEVIPFLDTQVSPSSEIGDEQPALGHRTAEATPDGGSLVFMSDNLNVEKYSPEVDGKRLEEVYVYEWAGDRLFCASCAAVHQALPANVLSEFRSRGVLATELE